MLYSPMRLLCLIIVSLLSLLSGCNSPVYNQTEGNVADVTQRVNQARHQSDNSGKPPSSLLVNQGPYVDSTPISLEKQPHWLKNHIVLHGEQLPFSYYSRVILSGAGRNVLTRYQVGIDGNSKVSMEYSGTVKGALDLLATKLGYVYSIKSNSVYWQAFVTKTFDIAFMPGSSDYLMGKTAGSGSSSTAASSSSGGGSGSTTTTSAIIDDSAASQYSNLKATLSVWKDLEKTIQEILSPDGKVMVSESTTSVTVRDRPTNVELVGRYIANLNNNLSRQVLVKVQVLSITLSSAFNFGINWNIVKNSLGNQFQLNANYGTPISISNLAPFVPTTDPVTGNQELPQFGTINSATTGVTAVINALTQQGKVSLVTEPRVVCLNNQVSVIRIINQQGYLASVQTTSLAGSTTPGGASITTQVTPGNVISGLTLYILPKIMGQKVFLQVNADLSTNNGIQSISSSSGSAPGSNNTAPVIQVPSLTQKQFNQRSVIASGETLILSGFREVSNQANAMQMFQSQSLGGKAAVESTTETIVLITPIILHGLA